MIRALITQRESLDQYGTRIDSLEAEYVEYFEELGIQVQPVPNYIRDIRTYAEQSGCRMLILTGGGVVPDYGYDKDADRIMFSYREQAEYSLITWALEQNYPVFGICRGMQILNIYFGGISTKSPVLKTARKVREEHPVIISATQEMILVNHFHSDVIRREHLAEDLLPVAVDPDNDTVEAFLHRTKSVAGVQWHPERTLCTERAREQSRILLNTIL